MANLTFQEFQELSARRCREGFPTCADWSLNDWAVALTGEVGEMCNVLKKVRRGDAIYKLLPRQPDWKDVDVHFAAQTKQELVSELADVIIYADLMLTMLGADTGEEVMRKFDEVSRRVGFVRPVR